MKSNRVLKFLLILVLVSCESNDQKDLRFNAFNNFKKGDYLKAKLLADELVSRYPNDDSYFLRSRIFFNKGEFQNAKNDIQEALHYNSEVADYYCLYGEIFIKSGNIDSAIFMFYRCIEKDTLNAIAYKELAGLLNEKEKYDSALILINKAIALKPEFGENYSRRGIIYDAMLDYEKAVENYTTAIKLGYDSYKVYINRSIIFTLKKKYDVALIDANKAVELNPKKGECYFNRGYLYFKLNDFQKSCKDWETGMLLNEINCKLAFEKYCLNKSI